jgi:hypothetical protein
MSILGAPDVHNLSLVSQSQKRAAIQKNHGIPCKNREINPDRKIVIMLDDALYNLGLTLLIDNKIKCKQPR